MSARVAAPLELPPSSPECGARRPGLRALKKMGQ